MIYRRRDFNPLAIEHQIIPASSLRLTSIQDRMISYTAKNTAYPYTHAYIYILINGRYKTSSIKEKEKERGREKKKGKILEGRDRGETARCRPRNLFGHNEGPRRQRHGCIVGDYDPRIRESNFSTCTPRTRLRHGHVSRVTRGPPSLLARTAPHNRPIDEKRLHGWNKLSRLGDD